MTDSPSLRSGFIVDISQLPDGFPTHRHPAAFWEALGRAVATFGFLEETLGKAIFALTATREYEPAELEEAYRRWLPTLKKALSDQLGSLIGTYDKAVRAHDSASIESFDDLIADLRNASTIRNVLCHGSWRLPDPQGRSLPFFVNKKDEIFQDSIDISYLLNVQKAVAHLSSVIISTVTQMGWQFPGSGGPGEPIMPVVLR